MLRYDILVRLERVEKAAHKGKLGFDLDKYDKAGIK
jgi:hypothetical protein